ncbi:hypothetical protein CEP53_014755 [Fusarium sp. AF-6]|nr:hypothetical protein CEP53_014755 [Fusarium sp. AF-6]
MLLLQPRHHEVRVLQPSQVSGLQLSRCCLPRARRVLIKESRKRAWVRQVLLLVGGVSDMDGISVVS